MKQFGLLVKKIIFEVKQKFMKKNITLFIALLSMISFAQSKKIQYIDFDSKEISYNQFKQIQSKGVLVGQNDDGTIYTLIKEREKSGKINDYKELINSLNSSLSTNLGFEKPLFISYSPGPDVSNTTNRLISDEELDNSKDEYVKFKSKLEKEINGQILNLFKKESQFIYEGNKRIAWKKDPNNEIEKRFFSEYHYWHSSFVIIFPNGEYNVYLGEFSYDYVFDYIKSWKKRNKVK